MIFKIDLKLFILDRFFIYLLIFFYSPLSNRYNARNHQFMFSSMLLTYI